MLSELFNIILPKNVYEETQIAYGSSQAGILGHAYLQNETKNAGLCQGISNVLCVSTIQATNAILVQGGSDTFCVSPLQPINTVLVQGGASGCQVPSLQPTSPILGQANSEISNAFSIQPTSEMPNIVTTSAFSVRDTNYLMMKQITGLSLNFKTWIEEVFQKYSDSIRELIGERLSGLRQYFFALLIVLFKMESRPRLISKKKVEGFITYLTWPRPPSISQLLNKYLLFIDKLNQLNFNRLEIYHGS